MSGNKSISTLSQGQLFAGRYQLGEKMGEGGMGAVFAAIDSRLGSKPVVIKVLHEDFNSRQDLVERLMMEAQVAAEIDHENIVNVTDRGKDDASGLYFVCYEKLKGRELLELIEAGSLEPAVTVDILLQVCSAMVAAHKKGIIHRDLKPENIFIVQRRSGPHVKVLDFGIAKLTQDASSEGSKRRTQTGAILGTPPYMAYEQLMAQALDARVDVHALGCILQEMVSGATPFEGDSPAAITFAIRGGERKPLVDTDLDSIVARATHWNRDERTPSVEVFSAQLEEYGRKHSLLPQVSRASAAPSSSGVIGNENPTPVEVPSARGQTHMGPVVTDVGDERRRRRPVRIVAAAVLVTLLAAVGIVVGVGGSTPPRRMHTATSAPAPIPTTPVTPVPGPVAIEPTPVTPPTPSVEPAPVAPVVARPVVEPPPHRPRAERGQRHHRNNAPPAPATRGCRRGPDGENICD